MEPVLYNYLVAQVKNHWPSASDHWIQIALGVLHHTATTMILVKSKKIKI